MRFSSNARRNDLAMSHRWKLAWACALLVTSPGHAERPPALDKLTLPLGSTQLPLGERMRLFGMPVDIRVFEIPASVDRAAQMLEQRYAGLSNIGVYPGQLVLSGEIDKQFWVFSLVPVGLAATRGTVSVTRSMALGNRPDVGRVSNITQITDADVTADDEFSMISHAWLPDMAHLKLQFEQGADDGTRGRTLKQVWTIPSSVGATQRTIRRNLLRDQWRLQSETVDTSHWQRKQTAMQLTVTAVDGGTGLLLLHYDGATF